jgi:hypothetical protein
VITGGETLPEKPPVLEAAIEAVAEGGEEETDLQTSYFKLDIGDALRFVDPPSPPSLSLKPFTVSQRKCVQYGT